MEALVIEILWEGINTEVKLLEMFDSEGNVRILLCRRKLLEYALIYLCR